MNDSINRQAAIDALMTILDKPNHAEFLYTDEICKVLNELPPAQPEYEPWDAKEVAEAMSYWLKRGFWWNTITELENAGFVICKKKMT